MTGLLTDLIRERLMLNGEAAGQCAAGGRQAPDFVPVVKLFTPDAGCTWLLTELNPNDPDLAFGLCHLGTGFAELGSVRISELEGVRGPLGLPIERDLHFRPCKTISAYADEVRSNYRNS